MTCDSENAERAVLAPLVFFPEATMPHVSWLPASDFQHPLHRAIATAAAELDQAQQPIDATTIRARALQNGYDVQSVLVGLADEISMPDVANHHALLVAAAARRRRWRDRLGQEYSAARRTDVADEDFFEQAEATMLELSTDGAPRESIVHGKVVARRVLDTLEARRESPGAIGVPTGFFDIDALTNGFQPSDLVLIAARPSMGKTALAMQAASNAAAKGVHAMIFSLEMSKESLMERLISAESGLDATGLRTGRTPQDAFMRAGAAASRLSERPLYFDDTGALALTALCSEARRWRMRDVPKDAKAVVVVDYLQLVASSEEKEFDRVTTVSKGLKALAKGLGVPVIALSQLNRALEARSDKRPMLSDLRSSGQLEQDADVIAFLYRDEVYDPETKEPAVAEFIVSKNRSGPLFTAKLGWRATTTSFVNLSRRAA